MSPDSITARLTPGARDFYHILIEDELSSTNTVLKTMAASGAPAGTVLIARVQTAGRGRLGRVFHSPAGSGLYMSVLVRPDMAAGDALSLTTCAAVACADAADAVRAVFGCAGAPAQIKWVNDIYVPDGDGAKKVCGILSEAALIPGGDRLAYAVIGMGMNLFPPPGGFPAELSHIAGALFSAEYAADAERFPCAEHLSCAELLAMAAEILNRLYPMLLSPMAEQWRAEYRSRSLLDGKRVAVRPASSLGGDEIPALVLGIDETMGLRVRYDDGREEVLRSGEVVLRQEESGHTIQASAPSVHLL